MTVYTSSSTQGLTLASNVKKVRYYGIGGGGGGAIPYVEKSPGPPRTWTLYNGTNPAGGSTSSGSGGQTSIRANGIPILSANGGGGGGATSGGNGGFGNFSSGAKGAKAQTCGSPEATPGDSPLGSPLSNVYGRGGEGASACSSCGGDCSTYPSTFGGGGGGSSFVEVNRGNLGANPGNVITWTVGAGGFQGGFGNNRFGSDGAVGIVIETYGIPSGTITANNSSPSVTSITVTKGTQVTLKWNCNSDTENVSIPQAEPPVSTTQKSGSVTFTPNSTRTYQLRLSNPGFNDVLADSIEVRVVDPPTFFLNASPLERINNGSNTENVNLNWGLVSGSANRTVWTSGGITNTLVTSNTIVTPAVTTTYTGYARDDTNNLDSPSVSRTITVYQPASAALNIPQSVDYGQQFSIQCIVANATRGATLSVSYTYANNQTIAGTTVNLVNGTNPLTSVVPYNNNGPLQINYTLSVLGGSITRPSNASVSKTVNVVIPPPTITSFTASPQNILSGKKSKLTWNVTGVAFNTISISSIGSSLAKIGNQEVSPSSTTTYTLTATNLSGTRTATAQVNVFQPPKVTFSFSKNPIVRGESTTLSWSTTGNATSAFLSPIIGSTPISSETIIGDAVSDTTYTITVRLLVPPDIDVTSSDTKTLIVLQPPTVSIEGPEKINYGEQAVLSYAATNSVTSLTITPIYTYRNETITGSPVTLQPGLDVTGTYTTGIPYTTMGPFHVQYIIRAVGFGDPGSELTASDPIEIPIIIDETPDNFIIPESRDKIKNEEPVISPDSAATSFQIQINDIDIPVEIKSNRPIEVRFDDEDTWNKIRPI
jgi:hypothetical protein